MKTSRPEWGDTARWHDDLRGRNEEGRIESIDGDIMSLDLGYTGRCHVGTYAKRVAGRWMMYSELTREYTLPMTFCLGLRRRLLVGSGRNTSRVLKRDRSDTIRLPLPQA